MSKPLSKRGPKQSQVCVDCGAPLSVDQRPNKTRAACLACLRLRDAKARDRRRQKILAGTVYCNAGCGTILTEENWGGVVYTCRVCVNRRYSERYDERERNRVREITTRRRERAQETGQPSLHDGWQTLTGNARRRGLPVLITKDQYTSMVEGAGCHYCGGKLPPVGAGLDRKDNNLGYTEDNLVPCCGRCNLIKKNYVSYEDMVAVSPLLWTLRRRGQTWPATVPVHAAAMTLRMLAAA